MVRCSPAVVRLGGGKSRDSRYIPNVLNLIREQRRFFLGTTLAGLALRLFFVVYFPAVTDDSRIYADLATNWLQHGIYGQTQANPEKAILPTDARLPGYPAFLAGIFWIFGAGNLKAVLLAQILVDLATCLIVADLARRVASERAARIAFVLAALCPFLANYAAAELTETLEIFFTTLALDGAVAALGWMHDTGLDAGVPSANSGQALDLAGGKLWAVTGAAVAACIFVRPDGGLLLAAVLLYLVVVAWKILASKDRAGKKNTAGLLVAAIIVAGFALAPLVPWTIRNWRSLHHFQPLAPRYANDVDELVPRGFNRWVKTWIVDYASVEEIYWNVAGEKIDPQKLPSRAIDNDNSNPDEKAATLAVIADYNESEDMTPELDARFANLAAERIRAHPVRYYVVLPLLRVADMWLRPRTELLPSDPRWWEFNDATKGSFIAVGFGLLNLAYVAAALLALLHRRSRRPGGIRWAGLLVSFLLLRSAFLGTVENPEPRYMLECYPAIIVLASSWLARRSWDH
ncbi:MAG TPA: glycosyltransferase family 39 protein [Candidatus Acidoferrales bacterium]|nr:glycosyltransferase family 39 protein [Candidatus Acidoferrales bacterium]